MGLPCLRDTHAQTLVALNASASYTAKSEGWLNEFHF